MIRRIALPVALLFLAFSVASAADLDGTWKGAIKVADESVNLVYVLKADGNKLTGTAEGPAGKIDLEDGKIEGNKIWFTVSFGDNHIKHEGELKDGKIKITTHMQGGDYEYVIAKPSSVSGVWKGEAEFPGGQKMELTYDLKQDGDKLSGTIESPRGKIEMSDAKLTSDGFTFVTKRNDMEVKHEATLSDSKLKIKVRSPNGDREYSLSRVEKTSKIAGPWIAMFKDDTGNDLPLNFDLKVDGGKLTGTVKSGQGDGELKNGKVDGDDISFDVDFGGNTITHKGKLVGDEIKLKVDGFGTSWDLNLKHAPAK
jgi:hypothetical protein